MKGTGLDRMGMRCDKMEHNGTRQDRTGLDYMKLCENMIRDGTV